MAVQCDVNITKPAHSAASGGGPDALVVSSITACIENLLHRHDVRMVTGACSMLFLIPSLSAIVCMFFIARYFAAKTRLVEKSIDEAIARKLKTSALNVELLRLREQNGVMRNLLIDMVENEGSVTTSTPASDTSRVMNARMQRRREIFGEAIFALQQTAGARSPARNARIDG